MALSRQEHWSRLPFPPPGDLPDPGIESRSPALQADSSPSEPPGQEEKGVTGDEVVDGTVDSVDMSSHERREE